MLSVIVSYKKQIYFYFILILIFLLLVEISLRFIESECNFTDSEVFSHYNTFEKNKICSSYNKSLGNSLTYNNVILYLTPNYHSTHVNINSDGFRGDEISEKNKYTVIFLGGSTTFGIISSSDEKTIPALVKKKLKEENIDVQVINAGIPGATSIDELYLLETNLLSYRPDLVIMYDGWNDIGSRDKIKLNIDYEQFKKNTFLENSAKIQNITSNSNSNSNSNSGTGILNFFVAIDYKTGIGMSLFFRDNLLLNSNIIKNETYMPEYNFNTNLIQIENSLKNNWNTVCRMGEDNSFLTINILHPSLGTGSRNLSNEEIMRMSLSNFRYDNLNYLQKFDIEKMKNSKCQNVLDLRNVFDDINDKTIYFDEVHVSDYGNEIISDKITSVLIPIIENNLQK